MIYCKKCVIPDTRPGITFDENGVCSACLHYEKQKTTDWVERKNELKRVCDLFRKPTGYDCIISVSGGKDSHTQTALIKEEMGMNPLLVSVADNFPSTKAGAHNIENISERFGCDIMVLKPNIKAQKISMRYCFEKYGKVTTLLDVYMYTYSLWIAKSMKIPLVWYGEDISYAYGGIDDVEKPTAINQLLNGVASGIPKAELVAAGIPERELFFYDPPVIENDVVPMYLSYFIPWDSYRNYIFAKKQGFHDLYGEWDRSMTFEQIDQVDSAIYLLHPFLKYPKLGHGMATDYASKFIRNGKITREQGIELVKKHDHNLDNRVVREFCEFVGYKEWEFWAILDKWYNREIFEKNQFGEWVLKIPLE